VLWRALSDFSVIHRQIRYLNGTVHGFSKYRRYRAHAYSHEFPERGRGTDCRGSTGPGETRFLMLGGRVISR